MKIKYFMQIYYSLESFPFTKSWRFSMIAILIAISLVYDFSNTPFLLLGFPILSFRYSKVSIHFIKYTSLFDWSKYNRSKKWLHSIKSPHFVRLDRQWNPDKPWSLAVRRCSKSLVQNYDWLFEILTWMRLRMAHEDFLLTKEDDVVI